MIVVLAVLLLVGLLFVRSRPFPRILFQTWRSKTDIPAPFRAWRGTWLERHPSWRHELWDDEDNRRLIAGQYPWFLGKYDGYDREIKRVDAVRYFFLFTFGGVYADLDFECLRAFDPLLDSEQGACGVLLGRMEVSPDNAWHLLNSIPNALMASKPGAPFWTYVFFLLMSSHRSVRPEAETGPVLLRRALKGWNNKLNWKDYQAFCDRTPGLRQRMARAQPVDYRVRVLEPSAWYPISWSLPGPPPPPESWAVTYWAGSWKTAKK